MPRSSGDDNVTVGFYGGGVMAEAILHAILAAKVVKPDAVTVCELLEHRRDALGGFGVSVTAEGEDMLASSSVIVLAVKPDAVSSVLKVISKHEHDKGRRDQLLISICAGITLEALKEGNAARKCARVMPNQPCLVGEAASAFTLNENCSGKDRQIVHALMGACGVALELPEKSIDAVTGVSGSGPAYVFMLIEAMTDGGVRKGLPRAVARQLAAQTVLGAAKMAVQSPDVHPADLRNRVESPGGTTIAATAALEDGGFRAAVIRAVGCAAERSKELGRRE